MAIRGDNDFKSTSERDLLFRNSKGKTRPEPVLPAGARIADTHCHLDMLDDPALALARAAGRNFAFIMAMTDAAEPAEKTYELLDSWLAEAQSILEQWEMSDRTLPRIRISCGVHPHNAKDWDESKEKLLSLMADPRTACVGEIGLDYHYDLSPRDVQRDVFAEQLALADEAGLPVALHIREAHDDAIAVLRECGVPQAGCLLHCFNLDAATLAPFLEMGCHVALGGPLTFKKSFDTRAAATAVPLDKLLTETDAPYMAPEPLRGTVCTPDMTAYTLAMLLECFGYSGPEQALALFTPRAIDVPDGVEPTPLAEPDFSAITGSLDAEAFAEQLVRNALDLLDRPATTWQKEHCA